MRAYLPISHDDLELFLQGSHVTSSLFAPTPDFVEENVECDEEEIEYLLSIRASEFARTIRSSEKAPGIVIALEIDAEQVDQYLADQITLNLPISWSQVQCALLTSDEDDELVWYATQEIAHNLQSWK